MSALLAGALSALLVWLPVVAYRLGERDGYRRAQWEQDCDWMEGRIRQVCSDDLDMERITDQLNMQEWSEDD